MRRLERFIFSKALNFLLFALAFFMAVVGVIGFVNDPSPGFVILAVISGFAAYEIMEDEVRLAEYRERE